MTERMTERMTDRQTREVNIRVAKAERSRTNITPFYMVDYRLAAECGEAVLNFVGYVMFRYAIAKACVPELVLCSQ